MSKLLIVVALIVAAFAIPARAAGWDEAETEMLLKRGLTLEQIENKRKADAAYDAAVEKSLEPLPLSLGRLTYGSGWIQQAVTVKNDHEDRALRVQIECGFFKQGKLIATDTGTVRNIAPGITGFKTVLAHSDINPDHAECRVAKQEMEDDAR
jgi:hypothetical protein